MKDTIQTISQFKENILFNCIITIFFIVVFIITLCIIKKKAQLKNSIQHKVWWVTLFLMAFACIRLFMFIPSVIDLSTNNICVVEVSDYSCRTIANKFPEPLLTNLDRVCWSLYLAPSGMSDNLA